MARSSDVPGIVVPPPVILLLGFLAGMGLDAALDLPRLTVPAPIGWAVLATGVAVGGWGALTFRRHRTGILPHASATMVVTDGPYRFTRNPMYLGLSLAYAGTALWLGRLGPLLTLLPTLAALIHLVVRREERYLAAKFGAGYDDYRARVRRWL